ncbi:HBL/NHE enterotoxin family protein [Bacillus spongiae]|uniref:HBL/NHE enterotoxin family protein n=1 Tax=Bacillus spongiae TaxID=2683610 RepID=A0ABU8HD59_9BACI
MRKVKIATLATIVATSSIVPVNVFGSTKGITKETTVQEQTVEPATLEATSLPTFLHNLSAQSIILQSYSLGLLKQPTVELEQIPTLSTHIDRAKENASYWLDTVHPQVIQVNQDVVGFNNKFQNYYDVLYRLAGELASDKTAKEDLLFGLNILQEDISDRHTLVKNMVSSLTYFKESLQTDYANFSSDANEAKKLLEGEEGKISQLESLLDSINQDIETDVKLIVTGTATSIAGIGLITAGAFALVAVPEGASKAGSIATIIGGVNMTVGGVVVIGYASDDLIKKQEELVEVASDLSEVESEVATLTMVKSQVDSFVETMDATIMALEDIERGWQELENGFVQLSNDIHQGINIDSSFIQSQLTRAKDSWGNVSSIAEKLQEANVVVENVE